MQNSILVIDAGEKIRRANTQAFEDLQVDNTVIGRKITDILTVIDRNDDILPGLLENLKNNNEKSVRLPGDVFIRCKDSGTQLFVRGQLTCLSDDEILFSFHNAVDELTRNFLLKMALSSTRIFPWVYDRDRSAMLIDPRYFTYTGIPSEDNSMTVEAFFERLHPDDREAMANAFGQQLNGSHYPYPVPFRLLRGDGRWEWFEGQSTYLGQINGIPYRIVGICMSTQAHKDIEEALIAARDKAEQSDRLKSAFLANISHEIRTPLNAIVGFSNLLTGGDISVDSEEAHEYVELINTNCTHLLRLISDILDLSRIESDTMEYNFSEQSLNRLLKDIHQVHKLTMPANVAFNLRLPNEDVRITTDPLRLGQLLGNLLANAEKFTGKGRIDFGYTLSGNGETAEIFVEDTGRGIPEEQFVKIFDRFHKIDSFVQGAGLGLSICKTIAERLGSKISVSSRLGEGSRFSLKLPLHPEDTAA
ncbi:MAG: PAS domain-containing sensor histidine kinase [Bacteroidales bacterium]|nr:PAS domain-containing sensor histidine kinase [Bacteroidales bacterium]